MLYIPRLSPLMVMRDGRCDLRELLTLTDSQCPRPETLPGPDDGGRISRISGLCLKHRSGVFVFVTVIPNRPFLCTAVIMPIVHLI